MTKPIVVIDARVGQYFSPHIGSIHSNQINQQNIIIALKRLLNNDYIVKIVRQDFSVSSTSAQSFDFGLQHFSGGESNSTVNTNLCYLSLSDINLFKVIGSSVYGNTPPDKLIVFAYDDNTFASLRDFCKEYHWVNSTNFKRMTARLDEMSFDNNRNVINVDNEGTPLLPNDDMQKFADYFQRKTIDKVNAEAQLTLLNAYRSFRRLAGSCCSGRAWLNAVANLLILTVVITCFLTATLAFNFLGTLTGNFFIPDDDSSAKDLLWWVIFLTCMIPATIFSLNKFLRNFYNLLGFFFDLARGDIHHRFNENISGVEFFGEFISIIVTAMLSAIPGLFAAYTTLLNPHQMNQLALTRVDSAIPNFQHLPRNVRVLSVYSTPVSAVSTNGSEMADMRFEAMYLRAAFRGDGQYFALRRLNIAVCKAFSSVVTEVARTNNRNIVKLHDQLHQIRQQFSSNTIHANQAMMELMFGFVLEHQPDFDFNELLKHQSNNLRQLANNTYWVIAVFTSLAAYVLSQQSASLYPLPYELNWLAFLFIVAASLYANTCINNNSIDKLEGYAVNTYADYRETHSVMPSGILEKVQGFISSIFALGNAGGQFALVWVFPMLRTGAVQFPQALFTAIVFFAIAVRAFNGRWTDFNFALMNERYGFSSSLGRLCDKFDNSSELEQDRLGTWCQLYLTKQAEKMAELFLSTSTNNAVSATPIEILDHHEQTNGVNCERLRENRTEVINHLINNNFFTENKAANFSWSTHSNDLNSF